MMEDFTQATYNLVSNVNSKYLFQEGKHIGKLGDAIICRVMKFLF